MRNVKCAWSRLLKWMNEPFWTFWDGLWDMNESLHSVCCFAFVCCRKLYKFESLSVIKSFVAESCHVISYVKTHLANQAKYANDDEWESLETPSSFVKSIICMQRPTRRWQVCIEWIFLLFFFKSLNSPWDCLDGKKREENCSFNRLEKLNH